MTEHPSLAAALSAFQRELPRVGKGSRATIRSDKGVYAYTYADLADVSAIVLPLLAEHGLSFSAKPTLDDTGRFVLVYSLRHTSDQEDTGSYPLPAGGTPQQIGSAITYARRYVLLSVTGVAPDDDDDDAAVASQVQPAEPEPVVVARARLMGAIRRHGWDVQTVTSLFEAQYPAGIGAETDATRIDKFREWLTSRPDHELRPPTRETPEPDPPTETPTEVDPA